MAVTHSSEEPFQLDEAALAKHGLSPAEWQRFRALEQRQREFHAWLGSHKKLAPQELGIMTLRNGSNVEEWASVAQEIQKTFAARQSRGPRRWMKKYQDFSSGVVAFIDQISPLLEVVKGLGDPSTALAIGTICGVFVLASRKNEVEEQALAIIDGIKERLPGYKMYQEIYNEDTELQRDLRKRTVLAYMGFVELCMEISRYCLQTSLHRLGKSIFVSTKLGDLNDDVNEQMAAIRSRCEELQALRIAELKQSNEELLRKIKGLEQERASSQLIKLQQGLQLADWTPQTHRANIEHYIDHLNYERGTETIYEQMHAGSIERYRRGPDFVAWEQPGQSALHLVVAYNHDAIGYGKQHCWLSPLALDVDSRLHQSGLVPHATFVFPPPRRNTTIFEAMPVVLVQLLRTRKSKLLGETERYELLLAAIQAYMKRPTPAGHADGEDDVGQAWHDKVDALGAIATRVLQLFGSTETVYVILDRIDQCCARDHYGLVSVLGAMFQEASCVVKVLMVADGAGWDIRERELRFPRTVSLCKTMQQGCLY
ncbi:hypothetical protein Micbo1qcDRAFT_234134 [Microdochium bolleyi]|uniref:DUF7708 domain-containing protein n=1 Tax=Microdochium bolleyi TaxID=196109 RepID=A0A136J0Z3_9PEZI|nr:hypothetical protein Micbo1qcDRAFT_234134 [Microdochium bolleyi]